MKLCFEYKYCIIMSLYTLRAINQIVNKYNTF